MHYTVCCLDFVAELTAIVTVTMGTFISDVK